MTIPSNLDTVVCNLLLSHFIHHIIYTTRLDNFAHQRLLSPSLFRLLFLFCCIRIRLFVFYIVVPLRHTQCSPTYHIIHHLEFAENPSPSIFLNTLQSLKRVHRSFLIRRIEIGIDRADHDLMRTSEFLITSTIARRPRWVSWPAYIQSLAYVPTEKSPADEGNRDKLGVYVQA